jgi:hypothetical protein
METKTSQGLMNNRAVRLGLGGAAGGAGLAAVLNLMHELQLEKKRRTMHKDVGRTDENTIVLTLPNKAAEITAGEDEPSTVKDVQHSTSSTKTVPAKSYRVGHYGTKQMKVGQAPWPLNTSWMQWALGTGGIGVGGVLGYKAVDALYQARLKRKLQQEEDAARQEMLDMLQNPGMKTAGWLDDIVDVPALSKQSQSRLDPWLGSPTLLWLLGTGGTAYLTKKLLDAKQQEKDEEGLDAPKVRRIVFRSQPEQATPELKQASAEDLGVLQAAMFVMMDKMGSETRVLSDPRMTPLLKQAGLSIPKLFKLADNADDLVTELYGQPELWKKIKRVGIENRPSMRRFGWGKYQIEIPAGAANWAANLPGIRGKTDDMLRNQLSKAIRGDQATPRQGEPGYGGLDFKQLAGNAVSGMSRFAKGLGQRFLRGYQGFTTPQPGQTVAQTPMQAADAVKYSSIVAPILSSFVGSSLARQTEPEDGVNTWDTIPERTDVNRVLRNISLEAEDPQAQAFLQAKRARIRKLLAQLVAEGKL